VGRLGLGQQLPSHFDYTSGYDLLVFRRLAAGSGANQLFVDGEHGTMAAARKALAKSFFSMVGCMIEQGDQSADQVADMLTKFA